MQIAASLAAEDLLWGVLCRSLADHTGTSDLGRPGNVFDLAKVQYGEILGLCMNAKN